MKIMDFELPKDYLTYLKNTKDYEIYLQSGECLFLFPIYELEEENNDLIVPVDGYFAIGSSDKEGGIYYNKEDYMIYTIPFSGQSHDDAELVAFSFSNFLSLYQMGELQLC